MVSEVKKKKKIICRTKNLYERKKTHRPLAITDCTHAILGVPRIEKKKFIFFTEISFTKEIVQHAAKNLLNFINKSPSPYHAVDELKGMLKSAGFMELRETEHWNLVQSQKYFVTRNESTIIAFAVGGKYETGNGFSFVGAHTDSPCLKVKPVSKKEKSNYLMVGVQTYGGGIWNTWLDRDLTLAGRVMVQMPDYIEHRLVNVKKPILRIPNIAIHLQRDMNDKLTLNKEDHLTPILATQVQAKLMESASSNLTEKHQASKHHSVLIKLLCDELNVEPEQIMDFELCLADCQPAVIGGALEEFLFSPRLDNLMNAYCACQGLIESCEGSSLEEDTNIRVACLYDNEEVGSASAQGAGSLLSELVMRRICKGDNLAFEESIPKSFHLSADQAHAVHPNFSEKHESTHQPAMHKGYVLKINANQKYATTAITAAIVRKVAELAAVPLQDFVVRNDMMCGSTIGPILSTKLGIPTVDVGAPQLSMHSIREQGCTTSVAQGIALFKGFFENYPSVFRSIKF